MPLANLGFEDDSVGTPGEGVPDLWTITVTATAEAVAAWGAGTPPLDEDGFEIEWNNDAYLFAFDVSDTAPPVFDTSVAEGEALEDFEEGWDANHAYEFELGTTEDAMFDTAPEAFEDFEHEWDSNESYDFTLGSSTAASFDVGISAQAFEDFEDGWPASTGAGNDYDLTLGSSTAASFDGAAPEAIEDFEESASELELVADPTTDTFTTGSAHGLSAGNRVTFRLASAGALPAGINPSFTYFVVAAGLTATTFRVSLASGGATHDFTDTGSGVFVVARDRSLFWVIEA